MLGLEEGSCKPYDLVGKFFSSCALWSLLSWEPAHLPKLFHKLAAAEGQSTSCTVAPWLPQSVYRFHEWASGVLRDNLFNEGNSGRQWTSTL